MKAYSYKLFFSFIIAPELFDVTNNSATSFVCILVSLLGFVLFKKKLKDVESRFLSLTIYGNSFGCERFCFCFSCFTFSNGAIFMIARTITFLWFFVIDLYKDLILFNQIFLEVEVLPFNNN